MENKPLSLLTIIILFLLVGCGESARIEITTCLWNSWATYPYSNFETQTVTIWESLYFGKPYPGTSPDGMFKFVGFISRDSILVKYSDDIFPEGMSVNQIADSAIVVIDTVGRCFSTKSYDGGTRFCLKVVY